MDSSISSSAPVTSSTLILDDVRPDDMVADVTRAVTPLTVSGLSAEKQSAADRSTTVAAAGYSLPSILSLSSFTPSSVDNNNVSINCSFTNSSIDSRDDDVCGLHVTFDEDNRPRLRPKDGSHMSVTGLEFLRSCGTAEKSAATEAPCPAVHLNHVPTPDTDTSSPSASGQTDLSSTLPAPVGKSGDASSDHNSNPTCPAVEPCCPTESVAVEPSCPTDKSGPASASVTPVRKSVRTHRHPLRLSNSEFVSLDISPRSRRKAAATTRLSLDNYSTPANARHTSTTSGTTETQSVPSTRPQSSKPRKEPSRTKKQCSSPVAGVERAKKEQSHEKKCSTSKPVPVKHTPTSAPPGEMRRPRGRPRKNQTAVNGKTDVQLAAGGSWSSLNSKAAGDSSLGNIGLVSELFSTASFAPVTSQSLMSVNNDSTVTKESNISVRQSDHVSVPSTVQSPVADVSFGLPEELSSFEQKHKKKKKKKKKKKSRHPDVGDAGEGVGKLVSNLDDLITTLRNIRLSPSGGAREPSEHSEQSSLDGCRVLAKVFSRAFCSQNVAASRRSFVVQGNALGSAANNTPTVNRTKAGRKASSSVGSAADAETRQSSLPPKKRHKLEMACSLPHNTDAGSAQGAGRGRRGRHPKLRANHLSQKSHVKTTKSCCKFCPLVYIASLSIASHWYLQLIRPYWGGGEQGTVMITYRTSYSFVKA